MGRVLFSCIVLSLISIPPVSGHVLEPLGTETPVTVPPGSVFGQMEYHYVINDSGVEGRLTTHVLPVEFEIGIGEKTQINLEAEILLKEKASSTAETESGIEEIAFGLKHRFLDEAKSFPAGAFLVEYTPSSGLEGHNSEFKVELLFSKAVRNRVQLYLTAGYLLETEREETPSGTRVENSQFFLYHAAPTFTIMPHHVLGVLELIGKTDFKNARTEVTLMPEVILGTPKTGFKVGLPFGLTGDSLDYGVRIGLSRLFD